MMYGGISISKGKKGFTLGFVGTINNECTKVYTYCKVGIPRKEDISRIIFEQIFIGWAKNYFMTNKEAPNLVMVYREGLSIPQIKTQVGK